ncbi:DUF4174 domain-containing protein [Maribacter chungangensis]|uniref:DUF4174 domain-containing protein n=1 Tax=Maribacter chungangensis TaxID=1069117 RepID=A0ABW3B4C4_9FLAO
MLFAQNISDYKWENRLIFLVDEEPETSIMNSQLKILEAKSDELKERDIMVFQLTPKTILLSNGEETRLSSIETYRSLAIPTDFKGIILVGKDGGVKLKKPYIVPVANIFTLIDGMPMRKSEIKRKKEG